MNKSNLNSSKSYTRPYTVGVSIAIIAVILFLLFHLLKFVIKHLKRIIEERNKRNRPVRIAVRREQGRRLTAKSVKRLQKELKKETKILPINQVEFFNEDFKKFNTRNKTRAKTVKIVEKRRGSVDFFAGRSHFQTDDD
ncbi:hypothetical protein PVAND_015692 [Polypedilum vanderplanki]|uniref:Uncharacterized protein n=1 Tax=Polypedilum vanderplanki TaxID=319348 RepID=A0A9J6BCW5_POLVA|nr:hypothetical protein PVAND_015692 [Polypedilum vanderplanki]